jgi:branched-chain amino acid transport system substrate-binding protein
VTRRVVLVLLTLGLLTAACGTRVTDETTSTATSLIERTVRTGSDTTGGDAASGIDVIGGTTGGTGGTTGGTSGGTTGGATGGTATGGAVRPASGEPIVLGAVGTKSGIVGAALAGGFRGLIVWEKWVNANGGIQGRPVRIIQVDDGADPGKHAAAVRRLILEEDVVAFIGNIAPFTFSAGAPILEEAGVPAIGGEGADRAWFNSPFAFPINGQNVSRSRPAAKWALANLPQRKAAVLFVSEADAPAELAGNFVDEWRRGGGQILMNTGVSIATPDFTGEVVQAKNAGADIMFVLLEKAACNRFFDATQRQGYAPVVIAPACVVDNLRDHRSVTTNKVYAAHAAKPVLAGRSPAEDEAIAAGKRFDPSLALDGAFMFGWLAGKLLQAALAQPGTTPTPRGIVDALHKLPATGLGGLTPTQAWGPGSHAEGRCGMISKFDGDKLVLQTPDFVC